MPHALGIPKPAPPDVRAGTVVALPSAGRSTTGPVPTPPPGHQVDGTQPTVPIATDTSDLHYTVDPRGSFVLKVTSKSTGEVIRTLNFKDFSPDVHTASKLAGHLVDKRS